MRNTEWQPGPGKDCRVVMNKDWSLPASILSRVDISTWQVQYENGTKCLVGEEQLVSPDSNISAESVETRKELYGSDEKSNVSSLNNKRGYHLTNITRGVYGEASKVVEEALEFQDANQQGVKVMELVELADLVGAVKGFLEKHHPGVSLEDLTAMAGVTRRAFKNGYRAEKAKP